MSPPWLNQRVSGAGDDDRLRVDHLAHHASGTVCGSHQHRVEADLLRGDFLQAAEQHVRCRVGPGDRYPSQPSSVPNIG